jgi:uncharacterized lipoprotein
MRKKLLVFGVISVLFQFGCAWAPVNINIFYARQQGVSLIKGAKDVKVNVKVVDLRQDKATVGFIKNGFGENLAPIIANEDVSVTIQRAIVMELGARGFSHGADAPIDISVELHSFYNDFTMGFTANAIAYLNMGVSVRSKKGELLYSKQITAQGIEWDVRVLNGDSARLALGRALQDGTTLMFQDRKFIAALLSSASAK